MDLEQLRDLKRQRSAMYHKVFGGPNGKKVLEDLQKKFGGTTLKKVDGKIDPHASIAAAGCREVILYIEQEVDAHATSE